VTIKVITTKDGVAVVSPYNREFVARAKSLAGVWDSTSRTWVFPAEVVGDVRAALRDVYGEDGTAEAELVRLRVDYHAEAGARELDQGENVNVVVGGREVARVFGRDSGAKLGANIVVRSGHFFSGGSVKNYRIGVAPGTVFDILRMPRPMAERLLVTNPHECRIVNDDGSELEQPAGENVVPFRAEG